MSTELTDNFSPTTPTESGEPIKQYFGSSISRGEHPPKGSRLTPLNSSDQLVTIAEAKEQEATLEMTPNKWAAIVALDTVKSSYTEGVTRIVPQKLLSDSQEKHLRTRLRSLKLTGGYKADVKRDLDNHEKRKQYAVKVLGEAVAPNGQGFSNDELNQLIDRFKRALNSHFDHCREAILEGDVDEVRRIVGLLTDTYEKGYENVNPYFFNESAKIIKQLTDSKIQTYLDAYRDEDGNVNPYLTLGGLEMEMIEANYEGEVIPISDVSGERRDVFVMEIGAEATLDPENRTLTIDDTVLPQNNNWHCIPRSAGEFMVGDINPDDVDNIRIRIFQRLAEKHDVIFTHNITLSFNLFNIIRGRRLGKGPMGAQNANYVETFNFSPDPTDTERFGKTLTPDDIGPNKYKNIGGSSSSHLPRYFPSAYISHGETSPIFIFNGKEYTDAETMWSHGYRVIPVAPLADSRLMHILLPSEQFRTNLVRWIDQWPEDRRKQVFGEHDIKKLFVYKPEDMD